MKTTSALTSSGICAGVLAVFAGAPEMLLLLVLIALLAAGSFVHYYVHLPRQDRTDVRALIRTLRGR